ncbi:MAG: DUF4153 domain-containing protein [Bacteroidota bacterium]
MTDKIKENINNPAILERLYRNDRKSFESGFEKIYPEIENSEMAKFWKSRLDFDKTPDKIKSNSGSEIFIMVAVCLFAGFLIKIPDLFNVNLKNFFFYEKNAGIIVFFGLTFYAIWINKDFSHKRLVITILIFVVSIIYINVLPSVKDSASINLAYIHLPLLMWCTYGLIYIDFNLKDRSKRIEYIKHNGDLAILGAIILIAGGALTGITIGLFHAIGVNIEKFYFNNIVIIGLVSAPVITTYILKNYNVLTNKIAPIVASLFSPLVLLTLVIYLIAIAFSAKDPYNDRDFLLIFNVMLIGVMGIIIFSISETSITRKQKLNEMVLFILSIITLIINLIALSAIFYRLSEYGLTPNRLAILGSNILIFGNLILIMIDLFKINFKKLELEKVEMTISKYLPIYILWTLFVVFGFPLIFGMK